MGAESQRSLRPLSGLPEEDEGDLMPWEARYSGPGKSGICEFGHPWDEHHLGMVMRQEYVDDTNEIYIPDECEHFGSNESGGLDADGNDHCHRYKDRGTA